MDRSGGPLRPKVVTFDCAETLVRVKWTPGGFALDCAASVGLNVGQEEREAYETLLRSRWREYQEVNLTRDPLLGDKFWHELTADWLMSIGQPKSLAPAMMQAAPDLLYSSSSDQFTLYEDVLPTLDALERFGIRVGVISNWDYSLHRVLRALNIHDRFEVTIASLEEGPEKPDPRLFQLTLDRFGVHPSEAIHVGDNPLDDLRGAQEFGMRAYLIDRTYPASKGAILSKLTDLIPIVEA